MSLWLLALALIAGCARQPLLLAPTTPQAEEISAILATAPLAANENIKPLPLQRGKHSSVSLIQIRDREQPHVHTRYDLTVVLVGGHGTLHIGDRALPMHTGDTAFIPSGTRHFFVTEGDTPAAALVTFAPPFDGSDQQPAP